MVPTATGEAWADRIRPHLIGAVEHIITAGRELVEAKESLPNGDFGGLLESLGLTARTGQRFMAIARNEVLANPTHVSHLPSAWGTLYELSRLPGDVLSQAIDDGTITPSLERSQVRALAVRSTLSDAEQAEVSSLEALIDAVLLDLERNVSERDLSGERWVAVADQIDQRLDELHPDLARVLGDRWIFGLVLSIARTCAPFLAEEMAAGRSGR